MALGFDLQFGINANLAYTLCLIDFQLGYVVRLDDRGISKSVQSISDRSVERLHQVLTSLQRIQLPVFGTVCSAYGLLHQSSNNTVQFVLPPPNSLVKASCG